MQNYEYKHVDGVDDNEDFQFASDVKGKKNNNKQPPAIKRAIEPKKQSQVVGKIPRSNGNIEETRNNDSGNYPGEADGKTPIKRNGLNRLNQLNRENSNNSNFNRKNGNSNGDVSVSDGKSTSSSAFRGEIDGKKYYNFQNTNGKKEGNFNTEEAQEDDFDAPESAASMKFKPNLIKAKKLKNNPVVQQNYD